MRLAVGPMGVLVTSTHKSSSEVLKPHAQQSVFFVFFLLFLIIIIR